MVDRALRDRLQTLSEVATAVRHHRASIQDAAASAKDQLLTRRLTITGPALSCSVLPLRPTDTTLAAAMQHAATLPRADRAAEDVLTVLTKDVPLALADENSASGIASIFAGRERREAAARAEQYLTNTLAWLDNGALTALKTIDTRHVPRPDGTLDALLDTEGPLLTATAHLGPVALIDLAPMAHLPTTIATLRAVVETEQEARARVLDAGHRVRDVAARRELSAMDIDRLREVTRDQLRLGAVRDAGIQTVGELLRAPIAPGQLPGIGETTAARINAAARSMQDAAREDAAIQIDARRQDTASVALVSALRQWEAAKNGGGPRAAVLVDELAPLADAVAEQAVLGIVHQPGARASGSFNPAEGAVERIEADVDDARQRAVRAAGDRDRIATTDDWSDFLDRPASYFALLDEVGLTDSTTAGRGSLPEGLIEQIEQFHLDTSLLSASLRGYQRFGAAFALVQERVVIGDEMGLGKTVEALAAIAHIAATAPDGMPRFVVVCPAAVVANWLRETEKHTSVPAFRIHGTERVRGISGWLREAGVAVTTYETLEWFRTQVPEEQRFAAVIVDEAHYVKNPDAKRTKHTRALLERSDRALLMSGTPLENRVEEFRVLIDHIRPDLRVDEDDDPLTFRKQIAPVYLRRSQEDVLTELPELVEVEEWTDLTPAESARYAAALDSDNFHTMRQLAILDGDASSKIASLRDVIAEARSTGRKTIVFSHYRAVLEAVLASVDGTVFGPLSGSTSPSGRQDMIDEFSAAAPGAVLVAQIIAGGVGLNIQAASVVVICEPQLKPTTEWQAIARARRMGQLDVVQVHRLLSEDGVDAALVRMLARKSRTFADFAAVSETASASAQAFDISESQLIAQVLADERARLAEERAAGAATPELAV
ncbi:ATP-dependent helicase [Curtobacterium sp. MCPF17_047]|uniref:DEAD/DEAH box helicase n=1 Tax=Curtobacterium sp. MCPF17_047 TaxID=2175654 RepID=UPI000DA6FFD3|nr:DEAD/DEAH box helicase [Curtobacterium sp. MCPF17_047]PZF66716.1 ATP-dependent helicase [Curtobacterium sp. MCPF17_047]